MKTLHTLAKACSNALLFHILLLAYDLLGSVAQPKVSWHKSYQGSGEESHPHYVIETKDRGFLMVGETGFVEDRSSRILAVKTDRKGDLIWKKEFGKAGYNLGNCVSEALDGHYLIAGTLEMDAASSRWKRRPGKLFGSRLGTSGRRMRSRG